MNSPDGAAGFDSRPGHAREPGREDTDMIVTPGKVYLATRGEYEDKEIVGVFLREQDARSCGLADDVEERPLRTSPMDVRTLHQVWVKQSGPTAGMLATMSWEEEYDGDDEVTFIGPTAARGWDLDKVRCAVRAKFPGSGVG